MEKQKNLTDELEERLIRFTVLIIEIAEQIPKTRTGNHISGQLLRCGTSPALNYGEVRAAESKNDFIHKIKVVLKELSETHICLKIIKSKPLLSDNTKLNTALKECNELISIFVSSVRTTQKKLK